MHHIYKKCMQSKELMNLRPSLVKSDQNTHLFFCKFVLFFLLLQFNTTNIIVYSRRLLIIFTIDNIVSLAASVRFTCLTFIVTSLLLNTLFQQGYFKLLYNH